MFATIKVIGLNSFVLLPKHFTFNTKVAVQLKHINISLFLVCFSLSSFCKKEKRKWKMLAIPFQLLGIAG